MFHKQDSRYCTFELFTNCFDAVIAMVRVGFHDSWTHIFPPDTVSFHCRYIAKSHYGATHGFGACTVRTVFAFIEKLEFAKQLFFNAIAHNQLQSRRGHAQRHIINMRHIAFAYRRRRVL